MRSIRIPGEANQVLSCIIEKTYGWQKKEDRIALTQFVTMTGIKKPHVCRAITKLLAMNMITQKGNGKDLTYSIQKNYLQWKALPKKVTSKTLPKKATNVAQKGKKALPKKGTTIDTTKDTTKDKQKHLEFIYLLPAEFEKLKKKWPQSYEKKIAYLDNFARNKPKLFAAYQSHYSVILNWNQDAPAEHSINATLEKPVQLNYNTPETKAIAKEITALGRKMISKNPAKRKEAEDLIKIKGDKIKELQLAEKVRQEGGSK